MGLEKQMNDVVKDTAKHKAELSLVEREKDIRRQTAKVRALCKEVLNDRRVLAKIEEEKNQLLLDKTELGVSLRSEKEKNVVLTEDAALNALVLEETKKQNGCKLALQKAHSDAQMNYLSQEVVALQNAQTLMLEAYPGYVKHQQPMIGSYVQWKHTNYKGWFTKWSVAGAMDSYGLVVAYNLKTGEMEVEMLTGPKKGSIVKTKWYLYGKKKTLTENSQIDPKETNAPDWRCRFVIVRSHF